MGWNVGSATVQDNTEPVTRSVAITQGSHQMLCLMLMCAEFRDYAFNLTNTTFDGDTFTRIATARYSAVDLRASVDFVYIDISGKATGTYNLYYDVSTGIPEDGRIAYFLVQGNASQNIVQATKGSAIGAIGTPSESLTTTKGNALVIDSFYTQAETNMTVGAGQTEIFEGATPGGNRYGASYKVVTSPASTTMSWSGDAEKYAHVLGAFSIASSKGGILLSSFI